MHTYPLAIVIPAYKLMHLREVLDSVAGQINKLVVSEWHRLHDYGFSENHEI